VHVTPVKLELDPGNAPDDADSAVDDSGHGDYVILDRPVGATRPPAPLGRGQSTGARLPVDGPPVSEPPSSGATETTSGDGSTVPADATTGDGKHQKGSLAGRMELEPDMSEPEAIDSAVDESEPSTAPNSSLEVPPYQPKTDPIPARPPEHSGSEDSEPVTPLAGRNLGRFGALAAVLVLVVIAAVIALTRGGDDTTDSLATQPTASAASPTAAAIAPTAATEAATELPAFELTDPPSLVICNDGSSFSGIKQPDGTFTDPDTGELLSCS
jgi:hypothetical protein